MLQVTLFSRWAQHWDDDTQWCFLRINVTYDYNFWTKIKRAQNINQFRAGIRSFKTRLTSQNVYLCLAGLLYELPTWRIQLSCRQVSSREGCPVRLILHSNTIHSRQSLSHYYQRWSYPSAGRTEWNRLRFNCVSPGIQFRRTITKRPIQSGSGMIVDVLFKISAHVAWCCEGIWKIVCTKYLLLYIISTEYIKQIEHSSISLDFTASQNTVSVPTQADCDALREPLFCGPPDDSASTYQYAQCDPGGVTAAVRFSSDRVQEYTDRFKIMDTFSDVSILYSFVSCRILPSILTDPKLIMYLQQCSMKVSCCAYFISLKGLSLNHHKVSR